MKKPLTAYKRAALVPLLLWQSSGAALASNPSSTAKVTEAHGDVFKRGFVDWEKEQWADPKPAHKGDLMQEGMQLGTGEKSWAQLTWSYITARAWANSVYAIAPNQRLVYLMGGEMLYHLDKHRKDKDDYFVWTKLIQARIRGTTVLFQCSGDTTRVTVLEGSIDVMNRKDKSIIHIEPGVVYEVKELQADKDTVSSDMASSSSAAAAATVAAPTALHKSSSASAEKGLIENTAAPSNLSGRLTAIEPVTIRSTESLPSIGLPNVQPVKIFQTQQTVTSLFPANPEALLAHPLLTALELPLSSLPLVTKTLGALIPAVAPLLNSIESLLGRTLLSEAKVLAVPKTVSYQVGPLVGSAFQLPAQNMSFFPPTGIIGKPGGFGQTPIAGQQGMVPGFTGKSPVGNFNTLSGLGPMQSFSGGGAISGGAGAVAGGGGFGGGGTVSPVTSMSGFSGGGGTIGGAATMMPASVGSLGSFSTSGIVGASGIGASGLSGVSSLTTGFSASSGATTNATAARTAPTSTGVGAISGAVSGLPTTGVSGLTGTVNNLLQNTSSGLGRLTGSLGLPLGRP